MFQFHFEAAYFNTFSSALTRLLHLFTSAVRSETISWV